MPIRCGNIECGNTATHRCFWPGDGPIFYCEGCASWMSAVAAHMGFTMPVQTLTESDHEAHDGVIAKQVAKRLGAP